MHRRALAAGAIDHSPVSEHAHTTADQTDHGMLQGAVVTHSVICGSSGNPREGAEARALGLSRVVTIFLAARQTYLRNRSAFRVRA